MIETTEEIAEALATGGAVVALESSIIAQGLPAPANLETARAAEEAVRAGGAVPATIAVIDGVARVGLDTRSLERLADPHAGARKAGAGDLAATIAAAETAGTTVSATAVLARAAGIEVFATGGIGGVHRGETGDESADLTTLSRVPVAVIASGPKCILDVPRTAERLETLGVPVIGFRTSELPSFYSRSSTVRLEHRVEDAVAAAAVLASHFSFGAGGVLLANPIPATAEIPAAELEPMIEAAAAAAEEAGIGGKALTPFLLARLREATAGRALLANRALVVANAELAAAVSLALAAARR